MNKITTTIRSDSMFLERMIISFSIVAIAAMTMTSTTIVHACTSTAIPTPEGTIIGRSMELGGTTQFLSTILQMNGLNNTQPSFMDPGYTLHEYDDRLIPWLLAVHPAGQQQGGCIICGLDSDTWNSTYGFVSVDVRIDPHAIFQNMTSAMEKESPLPNWMEQLGSNLVQGAVTLEALLMKQDIVEVSTDGMNEAGLTVSSLVLYESEYQTPPTPSPSSTTVKSNLRASSVPVAAAEDAIRTICWLDFSHWILGNFLSTSDLRETLQESANTLYTIGPLLSVFRDFNIHWRVDDAEGHSIVIEYLQGTLTIHNNTVGVLTNDPPFDWHLHNLGTYSHLQPTRSTVKSPTTQMGAFQLNSDIGIVPAHPGTGTNTLGLPGDYTSESRFVKMFYLTQFALFHNPMQTIEAALPTMSGLLNTVFIPIGTVPVQEQGDTDEDGSASLFGGEFTQYTVMKVPQQKLFYYKDYYNNQWRALDLSTMDLSQPAYKLLADGSFNIMDETNALFTN